ncbi:MAG: AraC family transcriptional regulator [Bacteroides sp.]|nr:AraC family transcriptional regulator [Bacteroides sp.]
MKKYAFVYDDVRITPERQIGKHSHHQWELSHVVRGGGFRTIGDNTEAMKEGEVILIPPDIPHVWKFDPDIVDDEGCIANITIFFESSLPGKLASVIPELEDTLNHIAVRNEARTYSGQIRNEIVSLLYSMRGKTAESRLPDMFRLLMLIARTEDSHGVGRNSLLSMTEQRMERMSTFCACNYARNISLEEIAGYVGMNKSAFCTFMKRHTGKTFSEYINEHRLARAMERLKNTDDNIADIAYTVGFSNVTYFNRLFKAHYGYTPKSTRVSGYNHSDI